MLIRDIERSRGDTLRHGFNFGKIDISMWTDFTFVVDPSRSPINSDNNVMSVTGQFVTDGTDSRMFFVPTGTVAPGRYYYEAQAVDANGEKYTFAKGAYTVTQDLNKN